MRNPDRLDSFYENLKAIHKNYIPDWRFGQFILNFIIWYYNKYKSDIFYLEEDKIIKEFRNFIDELGVRYA